MTRVPKANGPYTALPVKGEFGQPVVMLIDNGDIHRVMKRAWVVAEQDDGTFAPIVADPKRHEEPCTLGQWIADEDDVTYVNGDPMDCRRDNLIRGSYQ